MAHVLPSTLAAARILLRVLIVLNIVYGSLILVLLIASFVAEDWVTQALHMSGTLILGGRLLMVVGICATPLMHVFLSRLLAVVETVRTGSPFVLDNAARLQSAGWAMLGLQLLHLAAGAIAAGVSTAGEPLDIHWRFSTNGWLAVLLLFVLARVFDHGARMQQDLEGTV